MYEGISGVTIIISPGDVVGIQEDNGLCSGLEDFQELQPLYSEEVKKVKIKGSSWKSLVSLKLDPGIYS